MIHKSNKWREKLGAGQPVTGSALYSWSPAAMEALDGILTVEGLDFVLFGPADFSMYLGLDKPVKKMRECRMPLAKPSRRPVGWTNTLYTTSASNQMKLEKVFA